MIEKQHIVDCLETEYGIDVATLTFLPLGADMNASVYEAQTYDQTSYFVKLKSGHHGRWREMYKHFIDMFEPHGVVDIAFKTDEGLGPF